MAELKRATIYLAAQLHKALKLKAVAAECSVSELVGRAVQQSLSEDAEDLAAVRTRRAHASRDFSTFVRELRKDGLV